MAKCKAKTAADRSIINGKMQGQKKHYISSSNTAVKGEFNQSWNVDEKIGPRKYHESMWKIGCHWMHSRNMKLLSKILFCLGKTDHSNKITRNKASFSE